MGFLFSNYDSSGHNDLAEEPRKKGLLRLYEIFSRDWAAFFFSGFGALVGMAPFLLGLILVYDTHSLLVMLIIGLIGGMAAAPCLCGIADVLLRGLRDEPGFWWHRYKAAMRRNWQSSFFPGALFGVVFSAQCFTLLHIPQLGGGVGLLLCLLAGIIVSASLFLYVLMQMVLMELPLPSMLINGIWLTLHYLLRSLGAALVQILYWGIIVLCFPGTAIFVLLTNAWLPLFLSFFILYPAVNDTFHIEERLCAGQIVSTSVDSCGTSADSCGDNDHPL